MRDHLLARVGASALLLSWLVGAACVSCSDDDPFGGGDLPGDSVGSDTGDDTPGDDTPTDETPGDDTGDDTPGDDTDLDPVEVVFDAPPTLEDARVEGVRIAIPDDTGCATAGAGWDLTPLVDDRFCRYEWTGGGAPDASALPYAAECAAGGPEEACWGWGYRFLAGLHKEGYATTPAPDMADNLSFLFLRQAERVSNLIPSPSTGELPDEVRVAVIDSMPDGPHLDGAGSPPPPETATQPEAHGHAVGWMVHTLACQASGWMPEDLTAHPCLAEVVYYQALHEGVVEKHGRPDQLAVAIERAVEDWVADVADPAVVVAPHGMIVNLSLGWHPDYSDFVSEEIVRTAIERAVCRGALVLAAAGNSPGGQDPGAGPFYPARFALEPTPTEATCDEVGVSDGDQKIGQTGDLVTAVGGLTLADHALQSAMPNAVPFVSAPALHAVVPTLPAPPLDDAGLPTGPHGAFTASLTGTSASTAVASAVAAVVWAYRSELHPGSLVTLLMEQSAVTSAAPSFCSGTWTGCCIISLDGDCLDDGVRRLSVCRTLQGAMQGACDPDCFSLNPDDCEPCPIGCGAEIEQSNYASPVPYLVEPDCPGDTCESTLQVAPGAVSVPGCSGVVMQLADGPAETAQPCLNEQAYRRSMLPWVEPLHAGDGEPPDVQPLPDHPPCPNCFAYLDLPDTLELDLALADGLPAITGMGLQIQDRDAVGTHFEDGATIDLTAAALQLGMVSGSRYHVTLVSSDYADLTPAAQVLLTVRFATEAARASELGFRVF